MTLACRVFFHEFLTEFEKEKKRTKFHSLWYKPRSWTSKMLGTGKSRKKGDFGLIGKIGQKFGYRIQSEWLRIDQVWYYMLEEATSEQQIWKTDVIIEHENNSKNIRYTIAKMGEISAPLRVGIFYPEKNEEEILGEIGEMISRQVFSFPGGNYLVIFGFLVPEEDVYWHAYELDFKGNVTRLNTNREPFV